MMVQQLDLERSLNQVILGARFVANLAGIVSSHTRSLLQPSPVGSREVQCCHIPKA